MKNKLFLILGVIAFVAMSFAKNTNNQTNGPVSIQMGNDNPTVLRVQGPTLNQSREEIDLILDDFEGDVSGWNASAGWQLTTASSNSPDHSFVSPDELFYDQAGVAQYKSWDLFSPTYTLPLLGDGESMHFGFHLNVDMPDTNQEDDPSTPDDESTYLADYYNISIMDVADIAWQISSFNAYQGSSYWCGKDDVGNGNSGYLDAWVQYLDTPEFTVPANGTLSADMYWSIESFAGVSGVSGTCVGGGNIDGWDQANVQISTDGGNTFSVINGSLPYDFDCGYGMVYNGFDGAPGWGGSSDWNNVSFNLSSYAGEDAIVRFAFYSDPAFSALDDNTMTGFQVDNILVNSGAFSDDADGDELMVASGAVWVDQFYDYYDDGTTYDPRPGSNGWEEYEQGYPFNGNVFLDISDFQGKEVMFRFQSRYDENHNGGQGEGLFIDDFRVYKISGGNYPAPTGLVGEAGGGLASLAWDDMNFVGTVAYQFDNDTFDENNGIVINGDGDAWAGARMDVAGPSTVNSVSVFNINAPGTEVQIAAFGTFGTLFSPEVLYSETVTLSAGWNDIEVDWVMDGPFIIGHTFTADVSAALDVTTTSGNSMTLLGGTWDFWSDVATGSDTLEDGEWGIRAVVSQEGAGVTYNVYRDGTQIDSSGSENAYDDTSVSNNTTYVYEVTATYSDGEESGPSNSVEVTPQAQTVYEASYDDGGADAYQEIGSGNFLAVGFNASNSGEDLVRFKWYQEGDGGAFYIKLFEDDGGMPGNETFSRVVAGGLVAGWNEYDLQADELVVSGDFWVGIKAFSSTSGIGVDDSSSGQSYSRAGTAGAWEMLAGNAMIRLLIDEGENAGPSCTAGDVNADGFINVLDVVTIVNFIMLTDAPDSDQECASDYNEDGLINVLDVVSIVNVIMGS